MPKGLETTLRILTKTRNEAATSLLIAALDAPQTEVAQGALRALLQRHNLEGQREVIRRLHSIPASCREVIDEQQGRMTHALRDALLGPPGQMCTNACQAILWFREYDLIPVLINAIEDESFANRELAAETLRSLAELLHEDLSSPRDYRVRRDPQLVRQHVLGSLEECTKRHFRHGRNESLEAFLLLVGRDNVTLKKILLEPHDLNHAAVVECLSTATRGGILRLLLSFLDDPHAPPAAMAILASRHDRAFVDSLLKKIGYEPSPAAATNLRRIETIAWLQGNPRVLDPLDGAAQHAAVQLSLRSAIPRPAVYAIVEYLLGHGKPAGRRAAAVALAEFHGAAANALALRSLQDGDPQVQAELLRQLRTRGIPGALSKLIEMVSAPHEIVREAARESLGEFNLKRYLASYDMLDETVRQSTGRIVRKIDRRAPIELAEELSQLSRTRRLRALGAAMAMDLAPALETEIASLMDDDDHLVRCEAARALGHCTGEAAEKALRAALVDRSAAVQEVAEASLLGLAERRRVSPAEKPLTPPPSNASFTEGYAASTVIPLELPRTEL